MIRLFLWGKQKENRARLIAVRDAAPTAVEALARMFTAPSLHDDGTVLGRLRTILVVTEHRFIPGLHTGMTIGLTGFRPEFEDPWKTSADQVGHFLTAVRLAFDSRFLANPVFPLILGGWGDKDRPLRLIVGHEKAPDPANVDKLNLKTVMNVLTCFRKQYQAVVDADIGHFLAGNLETIQVGTGLGNSMADLRLSYEGWLFGCWMVEGRFQTLEEVAQWIRETLGAVVE
jgi:hypothetical protein